MSAPSPPFDLTTLNAMDRDAFAAVLGPAFENAPWVAAEAWSERPFASVAALASFVAAQRAAGSAGSGTVSDIRAA